MNKATTEQLIEDYRTEYKRVNNRVPNIVSRGTWIVIDFVAYRHSEVKSFLDTLRKRADFYATKPPGFDKFEVRSI